MNDLEKKFQEGIDNGRITKIEKMIPEDTNEGYIFYLEYEDAVFYMMKIKKNE